MDMEVEVSEDDFEVITGILRCIRCNNYLSVGPILVNYDGNSICGRCITKEENTKLPRNKIVEKLANLVYFPCQYEKYGCDEQFTTRDMQHHEDNCDFKTANCLISTKRSCSWSGSTLEWWSHCENEHTSLIEVAPYKVNLDRINGDNGVLIKKFGYLFYLQYRYEEILNVFFVSLCVVGEEVFKSLFFYTVNIKGKDFSVVKKRPVEFFDIVNRREEFFEVNLNSLCECLLTDGDFELVIDVILKDDKCFICGRALNCNDIVVLERSFCLDCSKNIDDYVERNCAYANSGCEYYDFALNMPKHEKICKLSKCKMDVGYKTCLSPSVDLEFKRDIELSDFMPLYTYEDNFELFWNAGTNVCIIVICTYNEFESQFDLKVMTNLRKSEACNIQFAMTFSREDGVIKHAVLDFDRYSPDFDWVGSISNRESPFISLKDKCKQLACTIKMNAKKLNYDN